jgi:hypothetical protein
LLLPLLLRATGGGRDCEAATDIRVPTEILEATLLLPPLLALQIMAGGGTGKDDVCSAKSLKLS